jgi:hypothetical protein
MGVDKTTAINHGGKSMAMNRLHKSSLLTGLWIAAVFLPTLAIAGNGMQAVTSSTSSDATPSINAAPTYDTDPTFGHMPNEDYTTPEADGRPGEYFFNVAAQAFEKKQYRHAINMYKVAASWAYKPAEYNLGLMYFRGQGVPVDRSLGTAWMVLAAERSTPQYMQARDLMVTQLNDAEFARTNSLWGQLKPIYGDEVALRRAKARWAYTRTQMTGSHTGGIAGHLTVGSPGIVGGQSPSAPAGSAAAILPHAEIPASAGHSMDGAIAYEQFHQSDNPYDPKLENNPIGTTSIGPLTPLKSVNGKPVSGNSDNYSDNH